MGHDFGMGQTFKSGWLSPHHAGKHGPQLGEVVREVLLAQVVKEYNIDSLPKGQEPKLSKGGNAITYFPTAESFNVVRETALRLSEVERQTQMPKLQAQIAGVEAALPHGAVIPSKVLDKILRDNAVTLELREQDYSADALSILNRDGWGSGYRVYKPKQNNSASSPRGNSLEEHEGIKVVKAVYFPVYSSEHSDYIWQEKTVYPDLAAHVKIYGATSSMKTSIPLYQAITPSTPARTWA